MNYYLRKISRGRWPSEKIINTATLRDIDADTVTSELRTDQNKLSVWQIDDNKQEEIDEIFIALGANCRNIGTIDAVIFDDKHLTDIPFEKEDGDTPAMTVNQKHRNITCLSYVSLGNVINAIVAGMKEGKYIRKTKGEMKRLLINAYINKKLDTTKMSASLIEEILKDIDNYTR